MNNPHQQNNQRNNQPLNAQASNAQALNTKPKTQAQTKADAIQAAQAAPASGTENAQQAKTILPADSTQAARELIKISQSLLKISDRESQALVQNDLATIAILQDEKEWITGRYQKASEEFRRRLEEFRGLDKSLIGQLDTTQRKLNDMASNNNRIIARIYRRAEKKTHETLLTAQEMGQTRSIQFADQPQQGANSNNGYAVTPGAQHANAAQTSAPQTNAPKRAE